MKGGWIWLLVALLLLGIGLTIGWKAGSDGKQAALTSEKVGTATCADANGSQDEVIKRLEESQRLDRAERARQQAAAIAVLKDREAEIQKLRLLSFAHRNTIVEAANADDDCKPLASMPVCAAIADGLWPVAEQAGRGQSP